MIVYLLTGVIMSLVKVCPNCSKEFKTYPSINKKCCSRKCSDELTKTLSNIRRTKVCIICAKDFIPKHTKSKGLYCSYRCSGISMRKEVVMRGGYEHVFTETHHRRNKQGYVPLHVLIAEKEIGRPLKVYEVVHHIDHVKNNNNILNLRVMTKKEHNSYHMKYNVENGIIDIKKLSERTSKRMKGNKIHLKSKRNANGQFRRNHE